jgi:hypothetical protein
LVMVLSVVNAKVIAGLGFQSFPSGTYMGYALPGLNIRLHPLDTCCLQAWLVAELLVQRLESQGRVESSAT